MSQRTFSTVATRLIDGFDTGATQAIGLYREGSDRLGQVARQRWDSALKQSAPQLSEETRRNAAHARRVFAGYYRKGVELSASGAEIAVATVVQAARVAVERAAVRQSPAA